MTKLSGIAQSPLCYFHMYFSSCSLDHQENFTVFVQYFKTHRAVNFLFFPFSSFYYGPSFGRVAESIISNSLLLVCVVRVQERSNLCTARRIEEFKEPGSGQKGKK